MTPAIYRSRLIVNLHHPSKEAAVTAPTSQRHTPSDNKQENSPPLGNGKKPSLDSRLLPPPKAPTTWDHQTGDADNDEGQYRREWPGSNQGAGVDDTRRDAMHWRVLWLLAQGEAGDGWLRPPDARQPTLLSSRVTRAMNFWLLMDQDGNHSTHLTEAPSIFQPLAASPAVIFLSTVHALRHGRLFHIVALPAEPANLVAQ
ncbi:hypothetical protein CDD80_3101 [Ophiocordyceps camponoti-rufipedis]|uniref:Uncharacterized protein n=1 Tax=Ophiocordyceps camponoti-rufipedis TaxID=2004952 RepID=A0A2C5Z335_9HYPO|nr:hypothetical protein CDD80_3101 [Ophiocordyceps camponoti-rufipedis]